jgi:hypothetical protein
VFLPPITISHVLIVIFFFFCSFLLGFVFPLMWYYGTFLYFGNYHRRDPRERAGLAAAAIAVSSLTPSLSK